MFFKAFEPADFDLKYADSGWPSLTISQVISRYRLLTSNGPLPKPAIYLALVLVEYAREKPLKRVIFSDSVVDKIGLPREPSQILKQLQRYWPDDFSVAISISKH